MRGKVKSWSTMRGTGWITPDVPLQEGGDVWFHFSDVDGRENGRVNFYAGDAVDFRLGDVGKGPRAFEVRRIRI